MKTQYKGAPCEEFSLDREISKNYGAVQAPKRAERVDIPPHLDALNGTAKVNLGYVSRVMEPLIAEKPSRKRIVPFSDLGPKEQQYFGLSEVEAALAEEPEAAYHGAASEGDLEAVQLRAEHGDTVVLHEIKEDDEE